MRLVFALLLIALPAQAWEFSPRPVCTLSHDTAAASVSVTFDPGRVPEYAITLRLAAGRWPDAPVFAMRFDGPAGRTISTTRHVLSEGGRALTVTDQGFGNLLDGLEFNRTAVVLADGRAVAFPLEDAAGPVAAFRACPALPLS